MSAGGHFPSLQEERGRASQMRRGESSFQVNEKCDIISFSLLNFQVQNKVAGQGPHLIHRFFPL
jgi:hypothetical protein